MENSVLAKQLQVADIRIELFKDYVLVEFLSNAAVTWAGAFIFDKSGAWENSRPNLLRLDKKWYQHLLFGLAEHELSCEFVK